jgi:hypothetical protein
MPNPPASGFTIAIYIVIPFAVSLFLLGCCFYVFLKKQVTTSAKNVAEPATDKTESTDKEIRSEAGDN